MNSLFHNIKTLSQIKDLKKLGGNIDKKDITGQTALHKMVKNNNLELVKGLLDNGASANIPDSLGNVPLFYVESEEMAECLVKKTRFPYNKNIFNEKLLDKNKIVLNCLNKKNA